MPVHSAMTAASPSCKVDASGPSGMCQTVCPWLPIRSTSLGCKPAAAMPASAASAKARPSAEVERAEAVDRARLGTETGENLVAEGRLEVDVGVLQQAPGQPGRRACNVHHRNLDPVGRGARNHPNDDHRVSSISAGIRPGNRPDGRRLPGKHGEQCLHHRRIYPVRREISPHAGELQQIVRRGSGDRDYGDAGRFERAHERALPRMHPRVGRCDDGRAAAGLLHEGRDLRRVDFIMDRDRLRAERAARRPARSPARSTRWRGRPAGRTRSRTGACYGAAAAASLDP